MVGHLALDQSIGVRIPVSQPIFLTQDGCHVASVFSVFFSILMMSNGRHQSAGAPNPGLPLLSAFLKLWEMAVAAIPLICLPS